MGLVAIYLVDLLVISKTRRVEPLCGFVFSSLQPPFPLLGPRLDFSAISSSLVVVYIDILSHQNPLAKTPEKETQKCETSTTRPASPRPRAFFLAPKVQPRPFSPSLYQHRHPSRHRLSPRGASSSHAIQTTPSRPTPFSPSLSSPLPPRSHSRGQVPSCF